MNQQANKHLQSLHLLSSQCSTLLNNKQVEQADSLIQKCMSAITQCDRASFIKVLTSFLKLFIFAPSSCSEIFYRRYYNILKDGFQNKAKNSTQQRYECLIIALFDVAQKHFASLFIQASKSMKNASQNQLLDHMLSLTVKGGLNLKGFIALLIKNHKRQGQSSKIGDIYNVLKDSFLKIYVDMSQQMKKSNKVYQNYSFKLFLFSSIFQQFSSKYQSQTSAFIQDLLVLISKSDDEVSNRILIMLQFLLLNVPNLSKVIGYNIIETKASFNQQSHCLIQLLATAQLLQGVNLQIKLGERTLLAQTLLLLKNRFQSIKKLLEKGIFTQQKCLDLERLILEMLLKTKLLMGSIQFSKNSFLQMTKTLATINSSFYNHFFTSQTKYPQLFQTEFYFKLLEDTWLTVKGKLYLILLYFNVFTSNITEYCHIIMLQKHIFNDFKIILEKHNLQYAKEAFLIQLYMFMDFKTSKKDYLLQILDQQQQKSTIINHIWQLFDSKMNCFMPQEKDVSELIQQNISSFQQDKYTFQNLVDLIIHILAQPQQQISQKRQQITNNDFHQLSLILFDKINIKPKIINKTSQSISFNNKKTKTKPQFCISLFTHLYENDKQLKSNTFFMKSIPTNELNSQKIIVTALRKYFGIYYNRINQLVIKKWIINREYLIIWTLLLSNYKVKTIAQQILKCGITPQEITSFFKIQQEIVKDFLQYLMTKDKYRFKLALFNCGLQHRRQLIDYFLPQLIL